MDLKPFLAPASVRPKLFRTEIDDLAMQLILLIGLALTVHVLRKANDGKSPPATPS